jgi:nitroimidazol reductase NimA-like FMN-containing flavoprotein (pyridoxamine 5'-phosphate oxidase superfamily)
MANTLPVAETSIDRYGGPVIPWTQAVTGLDEGVSHTFWLSTVRPDGRPHLMPVGGLWLDGRLYFCTGAGTRKGRNLAHSPECTLGISTTGLDIVIEGTATIITDEDRLRHLAEVYGSNGWRPSVRDGAFYAEFAAPSAGPPPWDVYEVTPARAFGMSTAEPLAAMRWQF